MICPSCGDEYREGHRECARCGVPLIDDRASAAQDERLLQTPHPDIELVRIFRSSDPTQLMIAESILRSAEVEYLVRGERVGELFGLGRFPSGMSTVLGPVELLVRREDVADATAMLEHLASGENAAEALEWSDDDLAEDEGEDV